VNSANKTQCPEGDKPNLASKPPLGKALGPSNALMNEESLNERLNLYEE
jgi:hypothetical protein